MNTDWIRNTRLLSVGAALYRDQTGCVWQSRRKAAPTTGERTWLRFAQVESQRMKTGWIRNM